jgi:2-haloacid dehalogenase
MKSKQKLASDRREFLVTTVGGLLFTALSSSPLRAAGFVSKIKAIAFDGFVVFDPRPVFAVINQLFPDKGKELTDAWRPTQFEYTWLRAAANKFEDFWKINRRCADFCFQKVGCSSKA